MRENHGSGRKRKVQPTVPIQAFWVVEIERLGKFGVEVRSY